MLRQTVHESEEHTSTGDGLGARCGFNGSPTMPVESVEIPDNRRFAIPERAGEGGRTRDVDDGRDDGSGPGDGVRVLVETLFPLVRARRNPCGAGLPCR